MRIVCAPDSFKESMTALQAARAMELGVHDALPDAECVLTPMSDGGEGFTDAIGQAWDAEAIEGADLVLTGEGKVDGQSARGKTPVGVAALAGRLGVPVFLFAGALGDGAEALLDVGATRIIAISMPDEPLPVALRRGPENLRYAVAAALRQSR